MPFTVVWLPTALAKLAEIWTAAANRRAVAEAANRIDRELRRNPLGIGRQRNGYRVYADPPLVVAFVVSPDDCMVRVVRVAARP